MASTTAASEKKAIEKWPDRKPSAYVGESAFRIAGWSAMPDTPQAPIARNQTTITGPNSRPTAADPIRWVANSTTMITAVIGTTRCASDGCTTLSPSTADSTEIAGVIMLSPKNSEAPKMPSAGQHEPSSAGRPCVRRPPDQGDQRHDAALAVVVGAHHQQHVAERHDDRHRPEDQRDDAEDALGARPVTGCGSPGLKTVWIV